MAKIKLLIAAVVIFLVVFRLWQSTGCRRFVSFEFDPLWVKLNVESQVGLDRSAPRDISRFFHNKAATGLYEAAKAYLTPLEGRRFAETVGLLPLIAAVIGLASIIRNKSIIGIGHIGLILIVLAIVLFSSKTSFNFYLLALAIPSLSIWSLDYFAKTKLRLLAVFVLAILTFYFFLFGWQMSTICYEIFFN